jgi:hypothetical protein
VENLGDAGPPAASDAVSDTVTPVRFQLLAFAAGDWAAVVTGAVVSFERFVAATVVSSDFSHMRM